MRVFLIVIGLVILGAGFWGGLSGRSELLWVGYLGFATALLAANLDQIPIPRSWRRTPETDARQLMREMDAALSEARAVVRELGLFSLNWARRIGSKSGVSLSEMESFRESIIASLKRLGYGEGELQNASKDWFSAIESEYVKMIVDLLPKPSDVEERLRAELSTVRHRAETNKASVDAIKTFLEVYELLTPELSELFTDYEHYRKTRRHRRSLPLKPTVIE